MIEIIAVAFLIHAQQGYFLKSYRAYLPKFLKGILLKRALPKYEEYIRNVNNIDIKLEFFIFPKLQEYSSKVQKIIDSIIYHRGFMVINLMESIKDNVHINSYLTYYIIKNIYKKFGKSLKNDRVGIVGIERAKRTGMLYEIADTVDIIYTADNGRKIEKISDELLREFGTVLVSVDSVNKLVSNCSVCFGFGENEDYMSENRSIFCIPERGIIYDNLCTNRMITLKNIRIDFIPLSDVVIMGKPFFCSIPVELVGILCEKLLLTPVDSYSGAKNIFTKDYFDVKIHLK